MYGREAGRGVAADSIPGRFFAPDSLPDFVISATINDLVQTLTLLLGFEMDCQF